MTFSPRAIPFPQMASVTARLRTLGYDFARIRARLGLPDYQQWAVSDGGATTALDRYLPALSHFLSQDPSDALDRAIRLLLLSVPLPRALAVDALGPSVVESLEAMQVLAPVEGSSDVQASVALWEIGGLFLATDSIQGVEPGVNPVMWLMPECFEFAAVRRPGKRVLDLCTGSGVHALLASLSAEQVTGVDISPRAMEFARFNQALNGRQNVRFLEGSLYQALPADARFDLILANPPYLPSPQGQAGDNFFVGGERGDALTLQLVAGLDERLEVGGVCQVIALWTRWKDADEVERLRAALPEGGARYDLDFAVNPISTEGVITFGGPDVDPDYLRATVAQFHWGVVSLTRRPSAGGTVQRRDFSPPQAFFRLGK